MDHSSGRTAFLSASVALFLLISIACTARAGAQSLATLSGVITDSSGAVIGDVRVTVTNTATNVTMSTVTNQSGRYGIVGVAPGKYSIEVTRTGFRTAHETNVVLVVNQSAVFNFVLAVGSIQQSVTVSAQASQTQSSTATLGTVIGTESVNNLPLNGRNFTELLELAPGISPISVSQNATALGGGTNPIGSFTFPAVNGQKNRSNNFLLDGINDLGSWTGTYNYAPVIDQIQEFNVQSHSDLAEFGQVTGGVVNIVTKSGTNTFHGSAWEFIRNSAFDSRDYFLPAVNPLRQNQFGVTFGGPVLIPHLYHGRDRTFFFFAYEGFRQSQAAQSLGITPTAAQLSGDFSGDLAQGVVLYNPFSTAPDPANPGEYTRTAFVNNNISSLINPAAALLAKNLFPAPNATGLPGGNNYIDTSPIRLDSGSYSGRVDQAFGQRDLLYGRISEYTEPQTSSAGSTSVISVNNVSGYNITVHELHTFSPTSVLELRFGRDVGTWNTLINYDGLPSGFIGSLVSAGFSPAFIDAFPQGGLVPDLDVEGYVGIGGSPASKQFANTWEGGGSLNKIWRRHNIKVGGIIATNNFTILKTSPVLSTNSFQTSNLEQTNPPSGDGLASFLLGVPSSAQLTNLLQLQHGGWANGAYVQDQFQVRPRLTLNVGLRWDVSVWPVSGYLGDGQGYVGTMNLTNGTYVITATPPACSSTRGAPCIPGGTLPANVVVTPHGNRSLHNTDYSNWQPRVGFAYHPRGNLSILGGYGRFYDNWSTVTQLTQNAAGTWPSVGLLSSSNLNQTYPTATLGDPLGLGSGAVFLPAATPFGNATYYFEPGFKTPLSDQWNLGIEQGLGANTVFGLDYVGSHSSRLDIGTIENTATYAAAGTAAQVAARQPYPYITPTRDDRSTGNSNYHALQTTLHKVSTNGLTYLLSYTWSKSIDLGCSGAFDEDCLIPNPYNPRADRSVSGYDLTNMFSGSVVYNIPFGTGRAYKTSSTFANNAFGGWNINAITSMTSGTPYSVYSKQDIANTGTNTSQVNLVGNPTPAIRTPAEWINPSAFQNPAPYTFGTFGRDALRSDWYRELDMSVFKTFSLTEIMNLEFRAEAFNITNTPVFAAPGYRIDESSSLGVVSSTANNPRQLQFAVKILF